MRTWVLSGVMLTGLCVGMAFNAQATHIVGGEIELQYIEDDRYLLRLIQYFDNFYGSPAAEDDFILITLFAKSDGSEMLSYTLPKTEVTFVPYTKPECAIGQLSTKRIVYEAEVILSADAFNEEEGYYAIWERCCRNANINNIEVPDSTGQTFFLEFPAVVREGAPFINTTPQVFPPLSDYACINRPFFFDFAGTDVDGDSLVYSLANPLSTSSFAPLPGNTPPPHPEVNFIEDLDGQNPIPSVPGQELAITPKGFLTVTPNQAGLFVFSVKVEEFREGERIGEVRRDFQMLVLADCAPAQPPVISAYLEDDEPYIDGDTIVMLREGTRCFSVYIKDPEPNTVASLDIEPVNFETEQDLRFMASVTQGGLATPGDSLGIEICLPKCVFTEDGVHVLDFIAKDDACAVPLSDTIRMVFLVEPFPNNPPDILTTAANDTISQFFGGRIDFDVLGSDPDGDTVDVSLLPPARDADSLGWVYTPVKDEAQVTLPCSWELPCPLLTEVGQEYFPLQFLVRDVNKCLEVKTDTVEQIVRVVPPPDAPPTITTSVGADTLRAVFGSAVRFDVLGEDLDGDSVQVSLVPSAFDADALGMQYSPATDLLQVTTPFFWDLDCDVQRLADQNLYPLTFAVEQINVCKETLVDTVTQWVMIDSIPNDAPVVGAEFVNTAVTEEDSHYVISFGEPLRLQVRGSDQNNDLVRLRFLDEDDADLLGYLFNWTGTQEALGSVEGELTWTPLCSFINVNQTELGPLTLRFEVEEDVCLFPKRDTVTITLVARDNELPGPDFQPVTIFTPNGDDINETFSIPDLPLDNCFGQFNNVSVFNRWGKKVFESNQRSFEWDGAGEPDGVYYWTIQYSYDILFKGWVTLYR
ncbi:MAG: gliding motility-associated C-terminal domain-containing protein [Bacteroidota bacterium]